MELNRVLKLNTPKGEQVLVNFNNISYCHKTNKNHTSLRFTYAQGKENRGVYLTVVEAVDQIKKMLDEEISLKVFKDQDTAT